MKRRFSTHQRRNKLKENHRKTYSVLNSNILLSKYLIPKKLLDKYLFPYN